ncbi:MAG: sugar transferase [Deltaproteobacteria bacterium]|nr:sugar transferase [Deltaproteobacteria bacterium]
MHAPRINYGRLIIDFLLVGFAWIAGWALRRALDPVSPTPINPIDSYLISAPLVALVWVVSSWVFGLYRRNQRTSILARIEQVFRHALLTLLVLCSVSFVLKEYQIGRTVVLFGWGLSMVLQVAHLVLIGLLQGKQKQIRTLVLGAGTTGVRIVQVLQDRPDEYLIVGFLDDNPDLVDGQVADVSVLGPLDQLAEVIRDQDIDQVITAIPGLHTSHLLSLVVECEHLDISHYLVTDAFSVLPFADAPERVGDLPLVPLQRYQSPLLYEPVKRVIDIIGALTGLLLTLPFWPWWAMRIRRDSPGSVFFRQDRVGRNGKVFSLLKFRTMRTDAEVYATAPRHDEDPRITPYGRWLRASSIDELPNLLNVLRGEMSLVGPRPEMPFIVEQYEEWQRRRLLVKPGLTGLWQILGRKDLPLHENLHYDFYYIHNRSLLLDVSLIVRTAIAVLWRKGAY